MKVAIVQKRTTYRKFVMEEHDPLLTRLLRQRNPTVARLRSSHEAHEETMHEVDRALEKLDVDVVFRDGAHSRLPKGIDLVITVGGDGTLLAASHQVRSEVLLLGINSAPHHSIGFFCGGKKGSVLKTLRQAVHGSLPRSVLSRMRVDLNGTCLHSRVLNEALFCHASPAATSRYILRLSGSNERAREEDQRSSGVWIGPAAGSTAAQRSAGGRVLPLASRRLQYVIREPYREIGKRRHLAVGLVREGETLTLHSKMRDGRVFLDGHRIVHSVTLGDVLVMQRSDETLTVLGLATKRRM